MGEVSLDRATIRSSSTTPRELFVLRADWRFRESWEGMVEGRMLEMPGYARQAAAARWSSIYRAIVSKNLKVGVGYNFTDFSDDLTDLSYDHKGVFLNMTGAM